MDATITNLSSARKYLPGGQIDLAPTGDPSGDDVRVLPDVTIADLDGDTVLKEAVLDGTVSVSVAVDTRDAAFATQGALNIGSPERYTVANLPTGYDGRQAFAIDGRAGAEGVGAGTGVPVIFTNGSWRRLEDMAIVAA